MPDGAFLSWHASQAGVSGALVDLAAAGMRRRLRSRPAQALGVAGLAPVALVGGQLVALALTGGVRWPPELVGGVVVLVAALTVSAAAVLGRSGAMLRDPQVVDGRVAPAG